MEPTPFYSRPVRAFTLRKALLSPLSLLHLLAFVLLGSLMPGQAQIILQNNSLVSNIDDFRGGTLLYRIDVPASRKQLTIETFGGAGNLNLYIRLGAPPTANTYLARSIDPGNLEYIRVNNPQPGSYYILLSAGETYSGANLSVLHSGSTYNAQIGEEAWSFDVANQIFSAPSVAPDGTIYVAGTTGTLPPSLYAINPDGTQKEVMRFNAVELFSSPVIGRDGTLYLTLDDQFAFETGRLIAISPWNNTKWQFPRPTHHRFPVAISQDDTLYIPSNLNTLLAINPAGGFKWEFTAFAQSRASSPAIVAQNGTVYCAFYNSSLVGGKIYAISPAGTNVWSYDTTGPVRSMAIDSTGGLVFGIADGNCSVHAIDKAGKFRWRTDITQHQSYVISAPVIGPDGSVYVTTSRSLFAIRGTGGEKWRHNSSEFVLESTFPTAPVIDAAGVIYYATSGTTGQGSLYAIHSTSQQLWRRPLPSSVRSPLVLTPNGNVVFGAPDGPGRLIAVRAGAALSQSIWPVVRQNLANTGALPPLPGAIQLTITPPAAVTAGAQWQINGGDFQNSGASVTGLAPGTYTVSFKPVAGWTTPSNLTLTVVAGQTTTTSAAYTLITGSLRVTITPAAAVTAGAQWQVDGGAFQNSGTTLSGLTPGDHTVSFKPLDTWTHPSPQTVTVNGNETVALSAAYVEIPQVGSITVNIAPQAAITAGAQWKLDDGPFHNSGATLSGLPLGNHFLQFKTINGWVTPQPGLVSITANQTTTVNLAYAEPPQLATVLHPNGQIVARVPTVPGFNYTLQTASSLAPPINWRDVQTYPGTGGTLELTLRPGTSGFTIHRVSPLNFYRLKIE